MSELVHKLKEEMNGWVSDLVTNSDLPSHKLLSRYAYEYTIKIEIINYFESNAISDEFEEFLMDEYNTLEYLYSEYMDDDSTNVQTEIEGFISNVIYKFKTLEK